MQLAELPPAATLERAYADAESIDYIEEEVGERETARRTLTAIERQVQPGSLLDIGCWVGFLLAEARDRGWQTTGVEPSEFASDYARDRLGLDVITAAVDELQMPSGSLDAVFMGDVIEHLVDPGAALERIRDLLRPGGVVALALPDAGSAVARAMGRRWWSILPTHVQYFTRPSIARLLDRAGFEVLETTTSPKAFTVAYYLGRTRGYSPRLARGLERAAAAVKLDQRLWAPDFRDRMLVTARR